jgi:hypothetical protein
MTGSRQSNLRSGNAAATPQRRNAAASAAALRHEGKMFAKFERIVKTANAHFD